jgi:hypothetical protein
MLDLEESISYYDDKNHDPFSTGFYYIGDEVSPASIYYVYNKLEQQVDSETRKISIGLRAENYYDGPILINRKTAKNLSKLTDEAMDDVLRNTQQQGAEISRRFKEWVDKKRAEKEKESEGCASCCLVSGLGCLGVSVGIGALLFYGLYRLIF